MLSSFLITLILVGVGLYLLNTLVPMDAKIKTVVNAIVLVIVFLYTLKTFGVISSTHLPQLK